MGFRHLLVLTGFGLASQIDKRSCLPAIDFSPEIDYVGCHESSAESYALTGSMQHMSNNSPLNCAELCGRSGFTYAGLENELQCWCGDKINGPPAEESSCSSPCPADPDSMCGEAYMINIYAIENTLTGSDVEPMIYPSCAREPLCSSPVCDTSLSPSDRAAALVDMWTVDEKIYNLVERAPGVPRLGIRPHNWWAEGLHGLADGSGVHFDPPGTGVWDAATSFPQPIIVGAAFDDSLVEAMAEVISTETRAFSNVGRVGLDLYTPNINSFKDPRWGRGQETPGEDPFHLQSYTRALLSGLERKVGGYKKVIATCKHFAGNDFESFGDIDRHNFDAQISLQDLNEFYLPPFRVCAEKDVGAFMCSYNSVNGAPACANEYLMQDILREHWGWENGEHYISTDCGAIADIWESHNYVETEGEAGAVALKAGADLECEFGYAGALFKAWNQTLIAETDLDKALTRMWASLISVGFFDDGEGNTLRNLGWEDVNTPLSQQLAYDAAIAGLVLLKNEKDHLPLNKKKSIALVGPWVDVGEELQGNYFGPAPYLISPLLAAEEMGLDFTFVKGSNINSTHPTFEEAIEAARNADEVIFMGGLDNDLEAESNDREDIVWPIAQLELLLELASLGKPITVVQFGGGQVDDTELLESKAIKSILWAGYPGQSGGAAVLDVLYGAAAPAGRLPVTQYPASYTGEVPPTDMTLRPFQNGTNPGRTHMWYSGAVVPFGFGLHFTKFQVKIPRVQLQEPFTGKGSSAKIEVVSSLRSSTPWMELLNAPILSLPIEVKNVGKVTSDYVALVFLRSKAGPTPRPLQTLVGYTRIKNIKPGEKKTATVVIQLERFLRVDEQGSQILHPGKYELFVDVDSKASVDFEWKGRPLMIEEFPAPK